MTDNNPQYERETCYFCHNTDSHIHETHHIVPQRYGGSDDAENLVRVCPNCHQKLERLYGDGFYQRLGVEREDTDDGSEETADVGRMEDVQTVYSIVDRLEDAHPGGAPEEKVIEKAGGEGLSPETVDDLIQQAKMSGEIYEPTEDRLRTT